ncbi:MAG: hypothetical protein AAGD05_07605 [Bacteroidota bacterium]
MRKAFIRIATGLSLCALLMASCNQFSDIDEIQDVEFEATYALPIINSVSTLADLLDSSGEDLSQLVTDEQGNYTFFYEDEGPEKNAQELFGNLPSFPFVLTDPEVSVPVAFYDNVEVQQLELQSGTIQFEFVSQYNEDVNIVITFPQLKQAGEVFSYEYDIVANGNAPVQVSTPPVSLAGYRFQFRNGQMDIRYEATTSSGQNVELTLVGGQAVNWTYEHIQGVWESDAFELTVDTLDIDVFEEKFAGEVSFADPQLTIVLENSFGFPVMAQINALKMVDEFGGVLTLESTLFDEGLHLDYPSLSEFNQSKTTTITFNRTNSNIVELLNSQPQQVIYDLAILINPDNSNTPGFLTDESQIKTTIKTEVPVYGTLSDFVIEETVTSDFEDADELVDAEFKLVTDNGLPLDVNLQFYFLDQNEVIIDSLFTADLHPVNAASVNSNGEVSQNATMNNTVLIPAHRMTLLKNSKNMLMKAAVSTSNDGTIPIRLQAGQTLDVKLGAIFGIEK